MTEQVLITGGAGFIGRALVRMLIQDRYRVTVLDDYRLGGKEFVADDLVEAAVWVEGDCRKATLIEELVAESTAVIHLAAPSSFLMYEEDPLDGTIVTIQGFLNILEALRKTGTKNLVYASTSAVYEGNPVPYLEDMVLRPPDLKALSKKVNEEMAWQYSSRFGIRAIGLRPFSVYGPDEFSKGGYANIISLFVWAMLEGKAPVLWGDGNQTRDFIFVEDAARAFKRAMEADLETQNFNVGTGIETTFIKVIDMINAFLGTDLQPQFIQVPIAIYAERLLADMTRAEAILGFRSVVSVEEGIQRVIEAAKGALEEKHVLGNAQMYFETLPQ